MLPDAPRPDVLAAKSAPAPLAIYIHWPYCTRICPYCDFNVFKRRKDDALIPAIKADLANWREMSGPREIVSIHFGGGTPSLLPARDIAALIETVGALWGLPKGTEIALEANPGDADSALWQDYIAAGVTRLSLGLQSFDDEILTRLGRDHSGAQGAAALELAMSIFPSVSADMIYGHSGQSRAHLAGELTRLLAISPPHISAYQLTIERGTAFAAAEARGQARAVGPDMSAEFYDLTNTQLGASGYNAYEVSNHAKAGHRSVHNLAYWQGHDYAGVGPGGHGRLTADSGVRRAFIAEKKPQDYIAAVSAKGRGFLESEILCAADRAAEYVLMGLRITEGISRAQYKALAGQDFDPAVLDPLIDMGLLVQKGERISAAPDGRRVLNTLCAKLLGA
jgi:oxygen-independent coproporphyrinogen-3 oxidase